VVPNLPLCEKHLGYRVIAASPVHIGQLGPNPKKLGIVFVTPLPRIELDDPFIEPKSLLKLPRDIMQPRKVLETGSAGVGKFLQLAACLRKPAPNQ
jgi:hypothetical protein